MSSLTGHLQDTQQHFIEGFLWSLKKLTLGNKPNQSFMREYARYSILRFLGSFKYTFVWSNDTLSLEQIHSFLRSRPVNYFILCPALFGSCGVALANHVGKTYFIRSVASVCVQSVLEFYFVEAIQ